MMNIKIWIDVRLLGERWFLGTLLFLWDVECWWWFFW